MNKIVEISIKVTQNVNEIKMGKKRQKYGKISPRSSNLSKSSFQKKSKKEKKHTRLTDLVLRVWKTGRPQIGSLYHSSMVRWHHRLNGHESG